MGDPEIDSRIAQYEMAFRMQASVPELTNLNDEPESTFKLYGEDAKIPGSHAANCLLARRLAERGVRFIQIFHRGWDHHSNVKTHLPTLAKETDQGSAALIKDLKQRGMLEDTLVIWAGNLEERFIHKVIPILLVETITPDVFRFGWQAAESKVGILMARPTTSATTLFKIQSTFMIFMQRCSIALALTTSNSPIVFKGEIID